jgi:hypothetical protein
MFYLVLIITFIKELKNEEFSILNFFFYSPIYKEKNGLIIRVNHILFLIRIYKIQRNILLHYCLIFIIFL